MKTIANLDLFDLDEFKTKHTLTDLALNRCLILAPHGYLFVKCANPYLNQRAPWVSMHPVRVLFTKRASAPPYAIWAFHDTDNPGKGPLSWSDLEASPLWRRGYGRPVGSSKGDSKSRQIWSRVSLAEGEALDKAAGTLRQTTPEFVRTQALAAARLITGEDVSAFFSTRSECERRFVPRKD